MSDPAGTPASERERRGRTLDRAVSFSDAVMSIALTLLVLPLVDIATDDPEEPILHQLDRFAPQAFGFVVSFLVIAQFWGAHRRLWAYLVDLDERLLTINTLWLLLIVFLPYPTARLFSTEANDAGAAIFYLLVLFGIGALMLCQAWYIAMHPELRDPDDPRSLRDQILPTVGTTAVFALAILLTLVNRNAGLLSLLLLFVVQRFSAQRPRPETRS
ncbi:TMEM175 family protein [Asanoa sp. WMMD1127]|uniref:TMEM175 family protein n=1 Tax=Asanoa sp. WMMD1127 TaxID=3016107 RepID=UPI0024160D8B|nr:TMEM175 family protein [Asanoa sp. WMMD1127]MDG4821126.1 TMEM175 family protein [Asanoa sp. WMMD1127]